MDFIVRASVSLLPVFYFLVAFVVLDSYKLVKFRSILLTILIGCVTAVGSLFMNSLLINLLGVDFSSYSKGGAPVIEELFKAVYIVFLIKSKRIGFLVDAAIYGFAIGAGFALVENIYYLKYLQDANIFLWILRGLGTAVMHGGTTAAMGIMSKNAADRGFTEKFHIFLPGIIVAIVIHGFFNNFIFSPVVTTVLQLILLPLVIVVVFSRSEKSLQFWLEVGLDTDVLLLDMITTGNISETKIGRYLDSLKDRFSGEIVADMLCLLRIHLELSVRAKGILMLREAGFEPSADPEIRENFEEMRYLEKSIGKTGRLAISPFLHTSSRELWQLHMLQGV